MPEWQITLSRAFCYNSDFEQFIVGYAEVPLIWHVTFQDAEGQETHVEVNIAGEKVCTLFISPWKLFFHCFFCLCLNQCYFTLFVRSNSNFHCYSTIPVISAEGVFCSKCLKLPIE